MNDETPQMTLDEVSWEVFKSRKKEQLQEILARLERRLKEGHPSDYNLDLDMLPILNAWNKIPFTYTVGSASGTMREHGTHECRNGLSGEPHGFILAYSFQSHPLFEEFRRNISEIPGFDSSLSEPCENKYYLDRCIMQNKGLFFHSLRIWMPEDALNKNDSYLITHWGELESYLNEFGRSIPKNSHSFD